MSVNNTIRHLEEVREVKVRNLVFAGTLAMALGSAHAAQVQELVSFTAGATIKSGEMNDNFSKVKTAVDDSQVQIDALKPVQQTLQTDVTTLKTDVATLKTDVATLKTVNTSDCAGNNATDVMVKIGTLCVDKFRSSLWNANTAEATALPTVPETCLADGTGCTGVVAQSRQVPDVARVGAISYAQAIQACGNAGKRLLTPGEWLLAFGSGQLDGVNVVGSLEFVDQISGGADPVQANKPRATSPVQGTYIGLQDIAGTARIRSFANVDYDAPNSTLTFLTFRCAR